ncbi:MAG TPA: LysM peptidoglycan-binding domain-containing protein, partial [Prolixibacteraceae bacterium]|nr:LysM peptidoglycan-binding domain-containing protein [Prolixibacteraceae bacterium]
IGSSGTETRYFKTLPEKISFSLLFDSTIELEENKNKNVNVEINKFKDIVFKYNGDIHRPNYLKLTWGNFFFKGQVESMQITYTAFSSDGDPQKAYADVHFIQVKDQQSRLSEENKSSPDLTHIYNVKEGDSLTIIANQIYGDPRYYISIAKVNNLNNFRKLKPGDQLILPPISK